MSRLLAVAALVFCLGAWPAPDAPAKGRGGGKGGHAKAGGGSHHAGSFQRQARQYGGRAHSLDVQRLREQRKLAHSQDVSQRLRDISRRNGNEKLMETADRMDQRAQSHYDKRMEKIDPRNEQSRLPTDERSTRFADQASSPADQHLLNEQRKLEHQMEVANHLREVAALNGNANLLQTAERMETMAAERYASQLEKFGLLGGGTTADMP